MGRVIKFRAWDGERIIYDNYSVKPSHLKDIDFKYFSGARIYHNKVECDFYESRLPNSTDGHFDHPTTIPIQAIMQFVGLQENCCELPEHNREIYEGDIIENIKGERLVVEWNDDTCEFQFSNGTPINNGETYGCHRHIIGNIYENPELLTNG